MPINRIHAPANRTQAPANPNADPGPDRIRTSATPGPDRIRTSATPDPTHTPDPTPHESHESHTPDATRHAILDAALTEFTQRGVAGASIKSICIRSGASVGSIYHHFGDKSGIAGALYIDGLMSYQAGFLKTLRQAKITREGVEAVVHHHARWIAENRDLARFLLTGRDAGLILATERPLTAINRKFFAAVTGWTRPRVDAGELRELGVELLTSLWIGPSQELARHWLAGRSRVSPIEAAPVLADAAWKSLSAKEGK
jgi:AcrR family transcriptional regulator